MSKPNKKYFRDCPSDGCDNIIGYSRKDSFKNAKNKNTICQECTRKKRGEIYNKYRDLDLHKKYLTIYYNKNKTVKEITKELGISFTTFKKIREYLNLPKIKRKKKEFDRRAAYKKAFKTRTGVDYNEFLKTLPDFKKYKGRVKYYTNKTIKTWGVLIGDLNKVGTGDDAHHVDHIVSIKDCFLSSIEPDIVADLINLRVIPKKENLSKGSNSLFSPEMLKFNVTEARNNKFKIKL